jgi:hypothetical protein
MVVAMLARLNTWLRSQLFDDVPADIELCEFDCEKVECSADEVAACERRAAHAGEGAEADVPSAVSSADEAAAGATRSG